ncbi:MAG: transketolase [Phycicoccus sp.]|nr:transketolase [Phycicoccus sp.]
MSPHTAFPPVTDAPTTDPDTDALAVSTLRFLAADMVQAAQSGHPGMPLGAAPMAWALWSRHLRHDPRDPAWADRDRFVLSAGHGSALLYGLLHVFGYDLPADELRQFRQLNSATPGHPEYGHTVGVETTTGPLGQGLAMAVGLALAERMQAARYPEITAHHTYVIAGDGCLMEGISHEAASLAGQLGLGRLIVLWDDNDVTIDGPVTQSCNDDQLARFAAYGWHVSQVVDGTDIDAIDAALSAAKADPRPSFLAVRTVIGAGAPGVEGTSAVHGSPLGAEVLAAAHARVGWTHPPFTVPAEVADHTAQLADQGAAQRAEWLQTWAAFAAADPARATTWERTQCGQLPTELNGLFAAMATGADRATRQSSQAVLQALTEALPELVGGSADLAGSTGTVTAQGVVTAQDASGARIHFGIREFAMACVLNGLSLHGGFRPYGSTFLVFSDYLRPALRLSALMGQPVIYLLTHDSVAVGEDGPTHQPVEHVESLRLIPGVTVLRPADDTETAWAWRTALENLDGPTVLVLSRQSLPSLPTPDPEHAATSLRDNGSRVVLEAQHPHVELVASGSEVALALDAAEVLTADGIDARVVSVPWRERWATTRPARRPCPSVSIEAGSTAGWRGLADACVGVDRFGASGPAGEVLAALGLTPAAVAQTARALRHSVDDSESPSC